MSWLIDSSHTAVHISYVPTTTQTHNAIFINKSIGSGSPFY